MGEKGRLWLVDDQGVQSFERLEGETTDDGRLARAIARAFGRRKVQGTGEFLLAAPVVCTTTLTIEGAKSLSSGNTSRLTLKAVGAAWGPTDAVWEQPHQAVDMSGVTLDGSGMAGMGLLVGPTAHYSNIRTVLVRNATVAGYVIDSASHVVLQDCVADRCLGNGIEAHSANASMIRGGVVNHCDGVGIVVDNQGSAQSSTGASYSGGFEVHGLAIGECGGRGAVLGPLPSSGIVFHPRWMEGNGRITGDHATELRDVRHSNLRCMRGESLRFIGKCWYTKIEDWSMDLPKEEAYLEVGLVRQGDASSPLEPIPLEWLAGIERVRRHTPNWRPKPLAVTYIEEG